MTEFRKQDLSESHFEYVNLSNSTFKRVMLTNADLRAVDFTGARITDAVMQDVRIRNVDLYDVEINGDLRNVVMNGVDVVPLIQAELDRRMPDRVKMRPTTAEGFREAWAVLERLWDQTVARARTLPEEQLHASVNGEWSFIQTLRHLNFATAAWIERMVLGVASPWRPLDLPWDTAPGWDGIPWDRDARPALDEVLAMRADRQASVRTLLQTLTDDALAANVTQMAPGWPQLENFPLQQCLRIVINEEWEHRLYAERDLSLLDPQEA